MKKDYFFTYITEFAILASGIIVYKLAANFLGKDGFSEYALSRRIISFLHPALLWGVGIGLARYTSMSIVQEDSISPLYYFIGSLVIVMLNAFIFLSIFYLFRKFFAYLLFGQERGEVLLPLGLTIFGLCLHNILYNYLRGNLKIIQANLFQFFNLGIFGLLPFFLVSRGDTSKIFLYWGISMIFLSSVGIIFYLHSEFTSIHLKNIRKSIIKLFTFGSGRVFAHLGLPLLLALPGICTTHFIGTKEGGYVAFSISMINMGGSLFSPIGIVFFPKISRLVAKREYHLFKNEVLKLYKYCLALGIVSWLGLEVIADKFIVMYLGSTFSEISDILRFSFIGYIPFLLYILSTNPLDAISQKPIYTKFIFTSLLVFTVFIFIGWMNAITGLYYILSCFLISLLILGFGCTYSLKREIAKYER